MKKTLLIFGIALLTFACKAQSDGVKYSNVYVNNISISDFGPDDFINTIGEPTSKSTYDIGFIEDVYKIGETRFAFYKNFSYEKHDSFQAGDLISFRIFTSDINVKINNTTIKVGDPIDALKSAFPNSYKNNTQYKAIYIYFTGVTNGVEWVSDDYLIIEYDENTKKITAIILYYGL